MTVKCQRNSNNNKDEVIKEVNSFKYLSYQITNDLGNTAHLTKRKRMIYDGLTNWVDFKNIISKKAQLYKTYIRPVFLYDLVILSLTKQEVMEIQRTETNIIMSLRT